MTNEPQRTFAWRLWITVLAPAYSLSIVERHISNGLCDTLWQRVRRGAASFCYRNRAEITVLIRAGGTEALSGMV